MARAELLLNVEVVYCPAPGQCERVQLQLPDGACAGDALAASGLCERHGLSAGALELGVWGRRQPPQALLRERDRVELYRPLQVDPKEARRLRYKRARQAAAGG
ncbi:MAG TPA: RnfH family protein [Rubrivivax sp.]|nr:RnfH family protein [Rubrivivax sp.]